jgi:hypothetical protein
MDTPSLIVSHTVILGIVKFKNLPSISVLKFFICIDIS